MKILLFARARELAGADSLDIAPPAPASVADLRRLLTSQFPKLAPLIGHCAFAANDEIANDSTVLPADAVVALLPPVSGG